MRPKHTDTQSIEKYKIFCLAIDVKLCGSKYTQGGLCFDLCDLER